MTAADLETWVDALGEILREFLVRCGSEDARSNLSRRLAREGLFATELRELCELVEARGKTPAETAAIIGHILASEKSWQAFTKDLAFARGAREKREAARVKAASEPYPNMPPGLMSHTDGPCAHGRLASESCDQCSP